MLNGKAMCYVRLPVLSVLICLNIARQDYEPQGASVTMLISEQPVKDPDLLVTETPGLLPDAIVAKKLSHRAHLSRIASKAWYQHVSR